MVNLDGIKSEIRLLADKELSKVADSLRYDSNRILDLELRVKKFDKIEETLSLINLTQQEMTK
jgi:hypothetical protein